MKNLKFYAILICLCLNVNFLFSQEITDNQKRVRSNIKIFLSEEGFSPSIDDDGDIIFKKEGKSYYVCVGTNESPLYISLIRPGATISDKQEYNKCLYTANKLNRTYKDLKVLIYDKAVQFNVEMFLRTAEDFRYVFYCSLGIIEDGEKDFYEEYDSVPSDGSSTNSYALEGLASTIPFLITDIKIANVAKDGTIETDYGKTIYDFATMYLKPKITISPYKTGTYTLCVRLYTPTKMSAGSTSPEGCSYKSDIIINSLNSTSYTLTGWGSETKGHWDMGTYRFEFWLGDVCVGSKSFEVR